MIDPERVRKAVSEDETLAALVASGTESAALEELVRRVYAEALDLLGSSRGQAALLRTIALAEAALLEVRE